MILRDTFLECPPDGGVIVSNTILEVLLLERVLDVFACIFVQKSRNSLYFWDNFADICSPLHAEFVDEETRGNIGAHCAAGHRFCVLIGR